jgi:acyl-CoA thioesterase
MNSREGKTMKRTIQTIIVAAFVVLITSTFAFAAAANSHEEVAVAINASISYLKGVKAGTLYAEAEEISNSRKISTYSIKITDASGQLIALFQGMAYKKTQR